MLYTDGITEAANPKGDEFGLDRLQAVVRKYAQEPLVALAVAIETAVEVFADGTPFGDDRTIVMLRREPLLPGAVESHPPQAGPAPRSASGE